METWKAIETRFAGIENVRHKGRKETQRKFCIPVISRSVDVATASPPSGSKSFPRRGGRREISDKIYRMDRIGGGGGFAGNQRLQDIWAGPSRGQVPAGRLDCCWGCAIEESGRSRFRDRPADFFTTGRPRHLPKAWAVLAFSLELLLLSWK